MKFADLAKAVRISVVSASLILAACGGDGGDSRQSTVAAPPPDDTPVGCPANQIPDDADGCTCPQGLHVKDGFCTDWAESVPEGAEFLESGYPLEIPKTGGSYFTPLYMKVGNIDRDPELELIYKDGTSPAYAWNHDGTLLAGWPTSATTYMHGKHVLAQFDNDPELEVFFGHEGSAYSTQQCELNAFNYTGARLPGWPQACVFSVNQAPVAVDLNQDGYDEVLYFDDDKVYSIDRTGSKQVVPVANAPSRKWCGMAVADVAPAPGKELALVNCSHSVYEDGMATDYLSLYLLSSQFVVLPGFPITYPGFFPQHPVIADFNADGVKEIMVLGTGTRADYEQRHIRSVLRIVSPQGTIQSKVEFMEQLTDQAELADIDRDGTPEILILVEDTSTQWNGRIHAYEADGSAVPGWPVPGEQFAVGDIDGDGAAEIVTFLEDDSVYHLENRAALAIYSPDGTLRNDLRVIVDYMGREASAIMPVIADIDLDGRNELIVIGDYWEGSSGTFPQVWAFDFGGSFPNGPVEWGQIFGNERNTGEYAGG